MTGAGTAQESTGRPFSLLLQIAGDDGGQGALWSADAQIDGWLAFERALALAQASVGDMPLEYAEAIANAANRSSLDLRELWDTARTVGYPILGLVRQVAASLPQGPSGRVHFGATTQDVMDTSLALIMVRSLDRLDGALLALGDAVGEKVEQHQATLMAARTHAQQAVPTTFGATLATLLGQLTRHRARLHEVRGRVGVISLFGAGGTSAALGANSGAVRARAATLLGLQDTVIPWHVERDRPAEFGWLCATVAATCAKLARNVIDLSRTEISEVHERYSPHRGASSTMPQKANPISSELIVGLASSAGALASALTRLQEAGHERSAGEWQIEWHVLPQLAVLCGAAVAEATDLVLGLQVDEARMRENLACDGGLVLAESMMITLAQTLGQATAHDVVYAAAQRARQNGYSIDEASRLLMAEMGLPSDSYLPSADDYLGEARAVCRASIAEWHEGVRPAAPAQNLNALAQSSSLLEQAGSPPPPLAASLSASSSRATS